MTAHNTTGRTTSAVPARGVPYTLHSTEYAVLTTQVYACKIMLELALQLKPRELEELYIEYVELVDQGKYMECLELLDGKRKK
jgi:hypothetical protein